MLLLTSVATNVRWTRKGAFRFRIDARHTAGIAARVNIA
jgi:hypothetical protein